MSCRRRSSRGMRRRDRGRPGGCSGLDILYTNRNLLLVYRLRVASSIAQLGASAVHTLIVVAHPNPKSLTHGVASHVTEGIRTARAGDTVEIADLAAEAFDPRFTAVDVAVHLKE